MADGKFIVIDGTDGSGKKTQSNILIDRLEKEGIEIAYYDFPQYNETFFGKMVGRYLNGEFGEADDVSPYLSSLLYAGDRWQAGANIKNDIKAGKIVISNRYTSSNMAFQSAKLKSKLEKESYLKWVEELEYELYGIPKPDLVIFLHVPSVLNQALVDAKGGRNYTNLKRDIHEKNLGYLKRAENEYVKLTKSKLNWYRINCVRSGKIMSIDVIADKVYSLVNEKIDLKNSHSFSFTSELLEGAVD